MCERSSDPPDEFGCSSTTDTDEAAVCEPFSFDLRTDGHASETSWKLEKVEGNVASSVGSGPPRRAVYADNTYYQGAAYGCLPPGGYRFTMNDQYGDGIIEPGYYRVRGLT